MKYLCNLNKQVKELTSKLLIAYNRIKRMCGKRFKLTDSYCNLTVANSLTNGIKL